MTKFCSDPFGEYPEADPYSGGYEPTASAQVSRDLLTKVDQLFQFSGARHHPVMEARVMEGAIQESATAGGEIAEKTGRYLPHICC